MMICGISNHMKNMKIKTKFVFILLISFSFFCCQNKKKVEINYTVFEVNDGWGYDIMINNKIFIHQDVIPSINISRSFLSKEDAEKVASLVVEKMKQKQKLPSVTKKEIEKLGVKTDS